MGRGIGEHPQVRRSLTEFWQTFFALGDPSRLAIIKRLAASGPVPMVGLTESMTFTRQAVLVSLTRSGREQSVSLDRTNFHLAEMFIQQMGAQWDDRLSSLKALEEDSP